MRWTACGRRRGAAPARPGTADALERFCREVLLSDRVQRCGTLREQTTVINAMLSQRYFTDRAPQYLWMPMETLTARLLEMDLRTEDALTCQMLFRRELRASLLRELDGVSGCWTGNTSGTPLFLGARAPRRRCFPCGCARARARRHWQGQNSLGEAVTVPLTPRALTERLRDGSLLPGLFLCFLEAHFLRDFTVFGGFYQPTYLAEMRRGLVRALRETGGYEEEAAIIEAKRSAMTLGLLYLLRSRESGRFPRFHSGAFGAARFDAGDRSKSASIRRGGAGASELNAQAGSSLVMGASGLRVFLRFILKNENAETPYVPLRSVHLRSA